VIWAPAALRDIAGIHRYIAAFNPAAATRLIERLISAGDSLDTNPRRGRPAGAQLRELTVVYPYIIRYRVAADQVIVLRVRHGRRQPI
jgi:addiction module RelE/StbE family toxin